MKPINKEHKEEIMKRIEQAGSEEYVTEWDEQSIPFSKKKSEIEKGKKARASGAQFELKVRKDLQDKGYVVDKWSNNVDLVEMKIIASKRKFNPFKKVMTIGTGFPDFIAIKHIHEELYSVIGVEVKKNGILSKEEKEKCAFYLKNKTFSCIWIAYSVVNGRKIEVKYDDFKEKYGSKYE